MAMLVLVTLVLLSGALAVPLDWNPRIIGGVNSDIETYPYQVSLRKGNRHFCGGSVIDENTILTAAHCTEGNTADAITVVVGTNALDAGGVAHQATKIISHEQYDPETTVNDIAIIKVEPAIEFNYQVRAVALASTNPRHGEPTILSGWGYWSWPETTQPNILQSIVLGALDLQRCSNNLAGAGIITSGHVCTEARPGHGACDGDSGGPLINVAGEQVGIVSWGIPCAQGLPDVFTSVAFYNSWIRSNMNN